jgi:hypothetical protein
MHPPGKAEGDGDQQPLLDVGQQASMFTNVV